jgi:hypothetical protein
MEEDSVLDRSRGRSRMSTRTHVNTKALLARTSLPPHTRPLHRDAAVERQSFQITPHSHLESTKAHLATWQTLRPQSPIKPSPTLWRTFASTSPSARWQRETKQSSSWLHATSTLHVSQLASVVEQSSVNSLLLENLASHPRFDRYVAGESGHACVVDRLRSHLCNNTRPVHLVLVFVCSSTCCTLTDVFQTARRELNPEPSFDQNFTFCASRSGTRLRDQKNLPLQWVSRCSPRETQADWKAYELRQHRKYQEKMRQANSRAGTSPHFRGGAMEIMGSPIRFHSSQIL